MARKTRKRDSRGRFVKRGAATRRRSKPRARRVLSVKRAVLYNPRRKTRRSYKRNDNPRRYSRHYRRNPASFGSIFSMGTLKLAAFTGAGFLGTPLVAGFVMGYIPITDPTTRKWVGYGVDLGAAWGLSFGVEKLAGREAGRAVLVGGLAYVAVSLVRDFVPQLLGTSTPTSAYPGLKRQPLIGAYRPQMGSALTSRTADRLNPSGRF